jgi:hypothetical protein
MYGKWEKDEEKGIIPRSLQKIFELIDLDNENNYTLSLSFLQIYMEMVIL